MLAYLVGQRTQEIGVRLAIGATPANVVRLFVREGAALTLVGVACGLAGALAVTRALSTLLFGVTTTDPATFAAVAGALALVALVRELRPRTARGPRRSDDGAQKRLAGAGRTADSHAFRLVLERGEADDQPDQCAGRDDLQVVLPLQPGHQEREEPADEDTEGQHGCQRPPFSRKDPDQAPATSPLKVDPMTMAAISDAYFRGEITR